MRYSKDNAKHLLALTLFLKIRLHTYFGFKKGTRHSKFDHSASLLCISTDRSVQVIFIAWLWKELNSNCGLLLKHMSVFNWVQNALTICYPTKKQQKDNVKTWETLSVCWVAFIPGCNHYLLSQSADV